MLDQDLNRKIFKPYAIMVLSLNYRGHLSPFKWPLQFCFSRFSPVPIFNICPPKEFGNALAEATPLPISCSSGPNRRQHRHRHPALPGKRLL
jgi:hypothetical protein